MTEVTYTDFDELLDIMTRMNDSKANTTYDERVMLHELRIRRKCGNCGNPVTPIDYCTSCIDACNYGRGY